MNGVKPGWGLAQGTFGELVQGHIENIPFLITLPIGWSTRAMFVGGLDGPLTVWPPSRRKALRAVELALDSWGKPRSGMLAIQSALPIGKGMASSSADIVASIRSAAAFYERRISPPEIAAWAASVDPTDGIMYPHVVAFNPLAGQLIERIGTAPPALIIGALGQGRINTEDHHRHQEPYSRDHEKRLQEALALVRLGIATRDVVRLGMAGRISAEVALERDPDKALGDFLDLAQREQVGVLIGHSGTVRGMLLTVPVPAERIRQLEQRLWALNAGPVYRILVGTPAAGPWSGRGAWPLSRSQAPQRRQRDKDSPRSMT